MMRTRCCKYLIAALKTFQGVYQSLYKMICWCLRSSRLVTDHRDIVSQSLLDSKLGHEPGLDGEMMSLLKKAGMLSNIVW